MTSNHTATPKRRCNAAPSGPGAPAGWRCAKPSGHKGELHQTATGGAWGPRTFAPDTSHVTITTAEVAAAFHVDARTIGKWDRQGRFGEGTVFWTPTGQRRFHADKIAELIAGAGPPPVSGSSVLTVAQVCELLRVHPKTISMWDRTGRFVEGTVFRTPGGHRRFHADKIAELIAGGLS